MQIPMLSGHMSAENYKGSWCESDINKHWQEKKK